MTTAPSSASMAATVLLPDPIPPVSPTTGPCPIAGVASAIGSASRGALSSNATLRYARRRRTATHVDSRGHDDGANRARGGGLRVPADRVPAHGQTTGRAAHAIRPGRAAHHQ